MKTGRRAGLLLWLVMPLAGCVSSPYIYKHHSLSQPSQIDQSPDRSMRWHYPPSPRTVRGVALVIHGLNLQPDKMNVIISTLTAAGIEVLSLSLRGHGRNFDPGLHATPGKARLLTFKTASHPFWLEEAHQAFLLVRQRSLFLSAPMFLVGFSYGGLLGADLFTSYPDVHFNKLALFAPALNCRFCFVLKWLTAFPRLVIPSFASPTYRANRGTPMAAYTALMDTIAHFGSRISSKLNVPTLIFIDPQDELVSHRKLKALVEARHLTNWRFHLLQKEPTGVKTALHHLIIDPSSIGKNQWNEVEKQLIQHLLPAN